MTTRGAKKVLFVELNEITYALIDPLVASGRLPTFERMFAEGVRAAPISVDAPPHLDPWVTWVTVHTGVDRGVHGATLLEQDVSTIRAKRTWEHAIEAGKSVGIFGSIGSYPARPVPGFVVPGPFAPSTSAFPPNLLPAHDVNRHLTQVHAGHAPEESARAVVRRALELVRLGLRPSTCFALAMQIVRERLSPHARWRRVGLQPLVNLDLFEAAYRRHAPDFATFHSNHAAHYMHHYWRAHDDASFLVRATAAEKRRYGQAVTHGYEICDRILARFLRLAGDDAVVVVASSMGQKPYVTPEFAEGRLCVRFQDVRRVLEIVGADGVTCASPAMVPQWNLVVSERSKRERLRRLFERAEARGGTRPAAFAVEERGEMLTITPLGHARIDPGLRYVFPGAPGAAPGGHAFDELFVVDAPTPKEGMHDPRGVLMMWGGGIRRGLRIEGTTNLDIAPTLLALLGVRRPVQMKGRVLAEAWVEPPPHGEPIRAANAA